MKFYKSPTKPPPYYSRLFSVIGDHTLVFQPFDQRVLTYSLTADRNMFYKSGFSFKPLRKISSFLYGKYFIWNITSNIQILIQNLLYHQLTLVKGLIRHAQQDASLTDLQTTKYCINELPDFMDAYVAI